MTASIIRIGVVSDTHASTAAALADALLNGLEAVDLILHAGDITARVVLERLARIAPVEAVYGNCDPPELRSALPARRLIEVGDWRIGLWHGKGGPAGLADRAQGQFHNETPDVVVFGHSHHPWNQRQKSILRFNPGSASQPRFTATPTFGILTLGKSVESAIITFE